MLAFLAKGKIVALNAPESHFIVAAAVSKYDLIARYTYNTSVVHRWVAELCSYLLPAIKISVCSGCEHVPTAQ